jgi:glycosyltransferase involved in cell wall biosynthesis
MRIAFIHPHSAFLPEINAYQKIFSTFNVETIVIKPEDAGKINADVEWHFMGIDKSRKKTGLIKIHEYTSASVPPFNQFKNLSKKIFNAKPDYRLFLNEYVKEKFDFKDEISFGFRDMGISDSFLHFDNSSIKKEFDFVYAGSVNAERQIEKLMELFTTKDLKKKSFLIISKDYNELASKFSQFKNIYFIGPITHDEMPAHISKSRFAINFMVDKEPFNEQTSTKLLEYVALKIPIISTDYKWAKKFQKENGGSLFYLKTDLSNFIWDDISSFNYSFADLKNWRWENQIRKSGVIQFLQSKFPESGF